MQALVRTESAGRPLAIGMDKAHGTVKQPATLQEAVATAKALVAAGRKFSVGLAQIHVSNVGLYGMTWEQAFDACQNLAVGQKILWNFYHRASASGYSGVAAIWAALRGYNSGGVDRVDQRRLREPDLRVHEQRAAAGAARQRIGVAAERDAPASSRTAWQRPQDKGAEFARRRPANRSTSSRSRTAKTGF